MLGPSVTAGRAFPWARPRYELLILALVAVAALSPVLVPNVQDESRLCLSEALLHGNVSNDPCLANVGDHSFFAGHRYSDKAPGLSLLAVPAVAVLGPGPPTRWAKDDLRLWGIRVLTVGVAFLLCAFAVGRVSEGLAPGFGGIALVSFALGTMVASLGAVSFEHVPAGALALGAFLLAWSRRPLLAGLLAGAALLVEYETGLILAVLACYIAFQGWRPLRAFAVGVVPGAVLLGAYDWAAFGSPWHLSYRYVANILAGEQGTGFFGIGVPTTFGIVQVFAGSRGLLVVSPVLVLAAIGLVRLGRTHRAEALAAGCVVAIFVLADCGYFDPYGGESPGPRFLVAGLPFLALGLGPAFSWRPRLTLVTAVISLIGTTVVTLTWTTVDLNRGGGAWGELARLLAKPDSALPANVLSVAGAGWGGLLVAIGAAGALAAGIRGMPWTRIRQERRERAGRERPSRRAVAAAAAVAYLVIAADVLALTNQPYGEDPALHLVVLHPSITAPSATSVFGGEVNFVVSVRDVGTVGAEKLFLTINLSPGMRLVGPPAFTRGSGCTGRSTLVCNLGFLSPKGAQVATVMFGVLITQPTDQQITAWASAQGDPHSKPSSFHVSVTG